LAGSSLSAADYSNLFAVGVPSYFAKAQVALPFLMDLFGLPHDLFQLYIRTTIISGKFDAMVTAMNLLAFALLGAGAISGLLVLKRERLLAAGAIMLAGTAVTVIAVRMIFDATLHTAYHKDEALHQMHTPRDMSSAIVHRDRITVQPEDTARRTLTLAYIRQRGTLRVGYDPVNLPFSFFNLDGELVGFDIELAERMAESFGVKAEFIPVEWPELPEMLADGVIDVMPGTWYRRKMAPHGRCCTPSTPSSSRSRTP
jgi:ABC-type amino acid transport substrate-binding protein